MEDRKLDMTILANYVRVKSPDKDKLAELVIRAKGPKRSMRQFAIDCGMNPSTLSRIVNKKIAGSNTDERILAIADHADPDSGVNFEMLMEAHGKVTKQMSGKVRAGRQVTVERDVEDILLRELLQRAEEVGSVTDEDGGAILYEISNVLRLSGINGEQALKDTLEKRLRQRDEEKPVHCPESQEM